MIFLLSLTIISVLFSYMFDRKKTYQGILKGLKMFWGIFPDLVLILVVASLILGLLSREMIAQYVGQDSGVWATIMAAIIGSVALIPGFIAFPLAAFLKEAGVSINVLAVFITTLMMVGIITFPIEVKFLGFKAALLRNVLSFVGALVIGLLMGVFL
ncbi:MAG: hypothetical protein A2381_11560 [Bdellovibrionales bacterium RIFOXYB1_FULL_37_110]|nr:MAG: hypothetical protein A2417_11865 [Bdellovibrionales bacterium RIFOXYC1_FULL_37_79]OFZ57327.1 MAG: hypothetical protein A2381_11560 [Bdellovibrionales bacterium RIFOXYB1_FULL_37_110]OFZ62223.1 MAG: hypothetical protein A2577_14110 [Bdellovibrionales bacterium RIFOXYD1_FULL_36_51]